MPTKKTKTQGRTIAGNIRKTLAIVKSVPRTQGSGLCTKKGTN